MCEFSCIELHSYDMSDSRVIAAKSKTVCGMLEFDFRSWIIRVRAFRMYMYYLHTRIYGFFRKKIKQLTFSFNQVYGEKRKSNSLCDDDCLHFAIQQVEQMLDSVGRHM